MMPSSTRNQLIVIGSIFVLVHVALYWHLGVSEGSEGWKYVQEADLMLVSRFPSEPRFYFYFPITAIIAASKWLNLDYGFVALVQTIFSAASTLLFFAGTRRVFGAPIAYWSSLLLVLFFPYFTWDFHLYSESTFFSFALLLYYFLCRLEEQRPVFLLPVFLCCALLIFTRPFGVLFIPPLLVYTAIANFRRKSVKFLAQILASIAAVSIFFIIDIIFHGGEAMDAMKPFKEEHVICFVAQHPEGVPLKLKFFDNGLKDIFYYIFHNPTHFAKLMLQRLWSFFKFTRPWYSNNHNLMLLLLVTPIYALALLGFARMVAAQKNITIFLIALLILYPMGMTFQCDDWHSRFTHIVMPPIFLAAAFGVTLLFERLKINHQHQ